MRLLVVEDEARIAELVQGALARAGFAVDAVALLSINTRPLSRSGAAITKAAAAASNIPPAMDHMIARFMALLPCTLAKEPQ
jgi:CheY-like chemotaxis protein